jgi:hypothetical protein
VNIGDVVVARCDIGGVLRGSFRRVAGAVWWPPGWPGRESGPGPALVRAREVEIEVYPGEAE